MDGLSGTRLNLAYLKRQAKELRQAHRAGDVAAGRRIKAHLSLPNGTGKGPLLCLREAQLVIAREHGFATWAELKQHIER